MLRALSLIMVLGGLVWWLRGEEARGRFAAFETGFLEVLLANSRDRFLPDPARMDQVVFLPLRQEDAAEYSAWPPQPVDYQMIIKGALEFHPSVVVLVDELRWTDAPPVMVDDLAEVLLPLPAVVVTAYPAGGERMEDTEAQDSLLDRLATLKLHRGEVRSLLTAEGALRGPETALLRVADPSLLPVEATNDAAPMLSLRAGKVHPSPALLGALRALKIPVSSGHIALGGGAGVLTDTGFYLPLAEDGRLPPAQGLKMAEQNALDLMTVAMVDDPSQEISQRMGEGRVLVLGIDGADHSRARRQAQALAHALAVPRVEVLSGVFKYVTVGLAALLGLSLLRLPKRKALARALLYLLFGIVACYLLFVLRTVWFSPVVPALVLLASGVFLRCFGRPSNDAAHG
jgi:hypothetical protein